MLTIRLSEYKQNSEPYHLTQEELDELTAPALSRYVVLTPTGKAEEFVIGAKGGHVGLISGRHVRVLLRPKEDVGIENVFFLLGFRPELIDWANQVFPYPEVEDLLRIIAWMLDREIRRQLFRGL